ncbi:glycoside hydrolase family 15 protein [Halogeometricum sp. S1BR25-6]|uniref:Glycoside hydrolase family 15 protein n=1 Tax=Halogeometricum salsisoli TaxID=2950536 RepID=A0ABU2GFN0_9EURY|nr:glycoside hydrolase family 15 protein [Halogeometricum sp. S1BR25-6]MDS0299598.1 glycoside hydrolase family 15 protein [Halogeometricum sp. S1BR25-6]
MQADFKPLEHYGVIGNLETCALVGRDGAVDWCCLPHVYSPSVFAAILDPDVGGRFAVAPAGEFESEQAYLSRTNVLQTTFETASGTMTVTDFMPVVEANNEEQPDVRGLYRKVTCTEGSVEVAVEFDPQFDYGRADTSVDAVTDGVTATGDDGHLYLSTPTPLNAEDGTARATYRLDAHDTQWYVLQYDMDSPTDAEDCERLLEETAQYWREWAHSCVESECLFGGRAHEYVVRSELVLKLLNYRETGALVAAPTTSLPENVGGVRNWDYRYSWIRDGGITVRALTNLGHVEEAADYVHRFLKLSLRGDSAEVRPLYGVEGDGELEEEELGHLRGYRDSRPVRIGNEAAEQQQLDVYGDLVLAMYQRFWSDGQNVTDEDWKALCDIADYVCEHWDDEGAGIWELRGEPRHLVYSKVMCWVALDRSIRLADRTGREGPVDRWQEYREEIKETVLERGFDEDLNSFTQSFEGDELDASSLLIVLSGILPFDDERIVGTVDAVREHLTTDDGLVFRYEDDGLPGEEGAFVFCSFWLVDALVATDRVEEAWDVFESVLEHASPLGLFAEEINPDSGRQIGNFPQGFSHIGLINSALYLREAEYGWATVGPLGQATLIQEREAERGKDRDGGVTAEAPRHDEA